LQDVTPSFYLLCLEEGEAMSDSHFSNVVGFYDTHPINEEEILTKLAARGANLDALTEDDLKDFDQDHYGGTDAVNALADAAKVRDYHHVLDVCSGMGGPARWLAHRYGCRVTGIDLTTSRIDGATRLTSKVGLDGRVEFKQGNATAMPFTDATFDAVVSQEAWCHIPDKRSLIAECVRVVKARGVIAFTDIVSLARMTPDEERRLLAEMFIPRPFFVSEYTQLLTERSCTIEQNVDLSDEWIGILVARLDMYRSLRDTTIAKFGEARYLEYDHAYSHFVGLFSNRKLGGFRVVARKA
jgi:ubiquinone/menaquinone biosynthesis C-methylase UbiE